MSDYLIDNLDLTGVRNVLNENRPMKIDVRSAESVFITIK